MLIVILIHIVYETVFVAVLYVKARAFLENKVLNNVDNGN